MIDLYIKLNSQRLNKMNYYELGINITSQIEK